MKTFASLLLLTAALATTAAAQDVIWVAGHWTVSGNERVWVSGQYVDTCAPAYEPAPCAPEPVWVAGRWVNGCHGWTYEQGYWFQPEPICEPPVVVCAPPPVCEPAVVYVRPRPVVYTPRPSVSISIGGYHSGHHGYHSGHRGYAAPVHHPRPPLPHEVLRNAPAPHQVIKNAPHHRALRKLFGKD